MSTPPRANRNNRGLGRGLGELFQKTDHEGPADSIVINGTPPPSMPKGSSYAELPVESITPNPQQPRSNFDEDDLNELTESVREIGVLQPVVVRPLGQSRYELVMGERRLRASKAAGRATIPAIIRETDEHDRLRDALLENLHRAQLNPLEEASAYQQMLDDFDCSQEELATRIKRSRPQISNTLRLLKLPPTVQRRVAAGVLSAGHARALLGVDGAAGQERLAQRIVAEGMSVRATEEAVALGEGEQAPVRTRARKAESPRATEIAAALSDRYETRVEVKIGAKYRGRIAIDFAGEDDLERILSMLQNG